LDRSDGQIFPALLWVRQELALPSVSIVRFWGLITCNSGSVDKPFKLNYLHAAVRGLDLASSWGKANYPRWREPSPLESLGGRWLRRFTPATKTCRRGWDNGAPVALERLRLVIKLQSLGFVISLTTVY
jgi:hypothetical protein